MAMRGLPILRQYEMEVSSMIMKFTLMKELYLSPSEIDAMPASEAGILHGMIVEQARQINSQTKNARKK